MNNVYGNWLKQQREAAGLTQQQLADLALMTRTHIAHIEAGRRLPSREDARRLDAALNTGNVLVSFLPEEGPAVADYFEAARLLEQQAVMIREFAMSFVPGILQTEAYARAITATSFPPVSEEECDALVVTRLARARILNDPVTPVVWALIDEAVLRRGAGGRAVMAEQVAHLVDLTDAGRVRVHVLPFAAGRHPLMEGMLSLLAFEDQPSVAYTEGIGMGKLHDSPSMVRTLESRYALALSDALPLQESLALLKSIARDLEGHG